jgi:cobalt transporter subunit CbtA
MQSDSPPLLVFTIPLTMLVTQTAFLVTKLTVKRFQNLMVVALLSGALAGLALFMFQQFTVVPLIRSAEAYESNTAHEDEGWQPANGWQRTSLTAIATVLSGIGFAAILFGAIAMTGTALNVRRGALFGLAGFVCFNLAPALGLPPRPPGVPVADLYDRQIWWAGTVIATAIGLWLLLGSARALWLRIGGGICLLMPHLVGDPIASGKYIVPTQLLRRFTVVSLVTIGLFWLLVGTIGGFLYKRIGLTEDEGLTSHEI